MSDPSLDGWLFQNFSLLIVRNALLIPSMQLLITCLYTFVLGPVFLFSLNLSSSLFPKYL